MLYAIVVLIEIIFCLLLQTAVFPMLTIYGIIPDIMIIVVVAIAYSGGRIQGMLCGVVSGLFLDFSLGSVLGLNALVYMLIGCFTGYVNKIYSPREYSIPLVMIGGFEFTYGVLYYFCNFFMRGRFNMGFYMLRYTLPTVVYTLLVAVILYKIFNQIAVWRYRLKYREE